MRSFIPNPLSISDQGRAWLGGFVFGLTGIRPDIRPPALHVEVRTDLAPDQSEATEFPWHDSSLPIVQRMELADGKPLASKLMAAMAQLDCGSCGYVCKTYSEAIAQGEESNLTLCSPGGPDTKRMLKRLLKESGGKPRAEKIVSRAHPLRWSRQNPFSAKLIESRPLNKPESSKETNHVAIDLTGSGLKYRVGDALGVCPTNCPELVAKIIRLLGADPEHVVHSPLGQEKSIALALLEDCCLRDPTEELLQSFGLPEVAEGMDVLDVLVAAGETAITPTKFVELLDPLNPRLYSIASSMKNVGDQVHLTVRKVTYEREGRLRKGVASTMLADRVEIGERVRVFVQPNHAGFTVPENTAAPMIMVGPGTGIAPFIAFLQERVATGAPGKNWLFFGNQHRATDFLYESELRGFIEDSVLTKLDTAFSRDDDAKVYVQHRMRENAVELWRWLQDGALFFVCGDASRMAKDVDQTLVEIVAQQGRMSRANAKAYVDKLSRSGRYVRDVY